MIETKLLPNEFETCIEKCTEYRDFGSFKYIYEVTMPNSEFAEFLKWLDNCELNRLSFVFL